MGTRKIAPEEQSGGAVEAIMFLEMRRRELPSPAWNEGVGEHVRTRSHVGQRSLGETAELKAIRTVRRKTVSSAGPSFGKRERSKIRSGR